MQKPDHMASTAPPPLQKLETDIRAFSVLEANGFQPRNLELPNQLGARGQHRHFQMCTISETFPSFCKKLLEFVFQSIESKKWRRDSEKQQVQHRGGAGSQDKHQWRCWVQHCPRPRPQSEWGVGAPGGFFRRRKLAPKMGSYSAIKRKQSIHKIHGETLKAYFLSERSLFEKVSLQLCGTLDKLEAWTQ